MLINKYIILFITIPADALEWGASAGINRD